VHCILARTLRNTGFSDSSADNCSSRAAHRANRLQSSHGIAPVHSGVSSGNSERNLPNSDSMPRLSYGVTDVHNRHTSDDMQSVYKLFFLDVIQYLNCLKITGGGLTGSSESQRCTAISMHYYIHVTHCTQRLV